MYVQFLMNTVLLVSISIYVSCFPKACFTQNIKLYKKLALPTNHILNIFLVLL